MASGPDGYARFVADPEVLSVNRLAMRAPFVHESDDVISLDGGWAATRYAHPSGVPDSAVARGADDTAWRSLEVPWNWTLQGMGDFPHYTNVVMP